jgi:hypothetical protein
MGAGSRSSLRNFCVLRAWRPSKKVWCTFHLNLCFFLPTMSHLDDLKTSFEQATGAAQQRYVSDEEQLNALRELELCEGCSVKAIARLLDLVRSSSGFDPEDLQDMLPSMCLRCYGQHGHHAHECEGEPPRVATPFPGLVSLLPASPRHTPPLSPASSASTPVAAILLAPGTPHSLAASQNQPTPPLTPASHYQPTPPLSPASQNQPTPPLSPVSTEK